MTIVRSTEALDHHVHGSTFSSYVAPSRGSAQLCAWRLSVPADQTGVVHRPTREEVLLILDGAASITMDGQASELGPGDVLVVPAEREFRLDSGPSGVTAWVTTTGGLEAVMADGTRLAPPWAN